jgi:MFS family permease
VNLERDRGLVPAIAGLLLAIAASAFFAWYPAGSSTSTSSSISSTGVQSSTVVRRSSETLLAHEGPSVLIVLAIPVVLAVGAIVVARWRRRHGARIVIACLLLVGCMLGAMSVGLFYVPAAALLMVSAVMTTARGDLVSAVPTR